MKYAVSLFTMLPTIMVKERYGFYQAAPLIDLPGFLHHNASYIYQGWERVRGCSQIVSLGILEILN